MRTYCMVSLVLAGVAANAFAARWYVDAGNAGTEDGTSWDAAYNTIGEALSAAAGDGGGEIWVQAGRYPETVSLSSNIALYGGFAGGETTLEERDFRTQLTIVDGQNAARTVTIEIGRAHV